MKFRRASEAKRDENFGELEGAPSRRPLERKMKDRIALGLVLALSITASSGLAHADGPVRRVVPPGGGLDAMDVKLDAGAGVLRFRRCKTGDCSDTGALKELPIPIDRSRIDAAGSTI